MTAPVEVLDLKILGNHVLKRRESLDLSVSDCARFAGISEKTLRKIEKGWTPKLPTALWVATVLGSSIEDLFIIKVKTRQGRRRKNTPATLGQ